MVKLQLTEDFLFIYLFFACLFSDSHGERPVKIKPDVYPKGCGQPCDLLPTKLNV